MIWNDCKSNPPTEEKNYIVYYENECWEQAWYYPKQCLWLDVLGDVVFPTKWAEIELPEL